MNLQRNSIIDKERLEIYLRDRLDTCKIKIKKLKSKKNKIKIAYYSFITISILGSSTALIISTLTIPPIAITILSGVSTVAASLSTRFKLEDEKNKIERKINELNEIDNYIKYVNACNGDLTQEKINEIYNKFKMLN